MKTHHTIISQIQDLARAGLTTTEIANKLQISNRVAQKYRPKSCVNFKLRIRQ